MTSETDHEDQFTECSFSWCSYNNVCDEIVVDNLFESMTHADCLLEYDFNSEFARWDLDSMSRVLCETLTLDQRIHWLGPRAKVFSVDSELVVVKSSVLARNFELFKRYMNGNLFTVSITDFETSVYEPLSVSRSELETIIASGKFWGSDADPLFPEEQLTLESENLFEWSFDASSQSMTAGFGSDFAKSLFGSIRQNRDPKTGSATERLETSCFSVVDDESLPVLDFSDPSVWSRDWPSGLSETEYTTSEAEDWLFDWGSNNNNKFSGPSISSPSVDQSCFQFNNRTENRRPTNRHLFPFRLQNR